jgi:hypothetical protein
MSEIKVDKISPQSGTALQIGDASDVITIPASATITNLGTATGFGGGKVLQIQSTAKTDIQTGNLNSWQDIMSVSITPATGSKVYVMASLTYNGPTTNNSMIRMTRDSTGIGIGDANGSNIRAFTHMMRDSTYGMQVAGMNFLDTTPGGNGSTAIAYKVQIMSSSDTHTWYVNTSAGSTGSTGAGYARGASTITVMEIGA